jgi:4-carboxymuconolactone decarboxylase
VTAFDAGRRSARVPEVDPATATEDQKAALSEWQAARNTTAPPGLLWHLLLASPDGMRRISEFGAYCRFKTMLPDLLREAAIYTVVASEGDTFEMQNHERMLSGLGAPAETVAALRRGEIGSLPDETRAVAQFATAMATHGQVSDEVFADAQRVVGDRGMVELAISVCYYLTLGRLRAALVPEQIRKVTKE